jgi:hypothetical protein
MSRGGSASGKRITAAERREKAWELRKRGLTFRAIAGELAPEFGGSYSKSQAERDIKHALNELNERTLETAAEARAIDLARLDDLLFAWFSTALREKERPTAAPGEDEPGDIVSAWFAKAAKGMAEGEEEDDAAEASPLDGVDWSKLGPMDLLEAVFKQAQLSRQATEIVLKIFEQRAKLLGLHRQELALTTPVPLQVATVDLSGLDEDGLNAIIRNLAAARGGGED